MRTRSKSKGTKNGYILQTNHDQSVKLERNGESHAGQANPLIILEITDHIFRFLKLSDIKNCRLVCLKWNQLAINYVKKLSAVNISRPESIEKFNQVFPNAPQSQIFTCFRVGLLSGYFKLPVHNFVAFFEKWNHNLSELTLFKPDLSFDGGDGTYDVSPLLPSTLKKLQIRCLIKTRIIISTDKMCNIRTVELESCILNIIPGTTFNSVEIDLENVAFCVGKEKIKEFLINPLLNFDVLKKASFSGGNIMLDLQGSRILDELSWQNEVTLINWKSSNWEIKKIFLGSSPFKRLEAHELSKSQIKYKQLKVTCPELNVSLLPEVIEKIEANLHCVWEFPSRISGEHNFPYLKHLHLIHRTGIDFSPLVEFFKHCPKLSNLTVALDVPSYDSGGDSILKTSSVPPSVKNLRVMFGVRIVVDRSLQLESLILNYPYHGKNSKYIITIAQELHVKNLIWAGLDVETRFYDCRNMLDNKKGRIFRTLINLNLDNFVVGPFSQVNNSEFEKSYLFPLVDTQGRYYLFQRGKKGKAISECDGTIYLDPEDNDYFQIK